ncbi:MAG: purine-binding chemotaxis protein CheW [Gammaproteobacteria bacterium]|nr:purine-binding chemotaxis protein CheW [Gammaproteobacteria bacterium]
MSIDQKNQMSKSKREFLTFTLGDENYGVDILKVREIRGWEKVRELHDTPEYVKGMLDLRGSIIPVIDLRIRFCVENYEYKASTVTIILATGDENNMMGVVVDSVSDVLAVDQNEIKQAPNLGARIKTDYVEGIVSVDDDLVMLVDSDKLLDTETFEILSQLEGVA